MFYALYLMVKLLLDELSAFFDVPLTVSLNAPNRLFKSVDLIKAQLKVNF
jgi:hypothetical protein